MNKNGGREVRKKDCRKSINQLLEESEEKFKKKTLDEIKKNKDSQQNLFGEDRPDD